jgi:hypothetical protein
MIAPVPCLPRTLQELKRADQPASSSRILYPYEGTVFPRGLPAPVLQWDVSMADAVYVHARSMLFEYEGCFTGSHINRNHLHDWLQRPRSDVRLHGHSTLQVSRGHCAELRWRDHRIRQLSGSDAHARVMTMHGSAADNVIVAIRRDSETYDNYMQEKGAFVINCDHGGGDCGAPGALQAAAWQFMKDHPFGTRPSPYAGGLPSGFHQSCKIWQKTSLRPLGERSMMTTTP